MKQNFECWSCGTKIEELSCVNICEDGIEPTCQKCLSYFKKQGIVKGDVQ